ncbi:MAG: asparagine synthase-related protein [Pseudomonadota bacterium]
MSGLCGWFGQAATLQVERMAAPLSRFDAAPLGSGSVGGGALALAALPGSATLHHEDGLLIALWGAPVSGLGRLWRTLGEHMCASLCGAFALAVIDERKEELFLAIDRSGTHPLCYQMVGRTLAFASSSDALLRYPGTSRRIDSQSLYNYLYFHMIPAPDSVYCEQRRLMPGQYLRFRGGRVERGKYWTMSFQENAAADLPALKEEFISTMRQAVRSAQGEHAVGAFLSGGTDSSTITALLAEVGQHPVRTYSIGFDAPGYDEMEYARLVARHFSTLHRERYVTPGDIVDAIPHIASVFDQPFGNASAVPAYYCAQMARDGGVVRMLGGDGGDELFGGNERYARQAVFSRYDTIPPALRQVLIEPVLFRLAGAMRGKLVSKARSYVEQASVPLPARLETYNLLHHYGVPTVLEADFLADVDIHAPLAALNQAYWLTHGQSQINQLLALDLQFTLADNDLPKVMKACELAGVEAAFPFLDDAVVAFSARLSARQKLKGTRLRYFFKQALRETLPREVISKKKHGFGLPFGYWLQTDARLRSLAYDSLSDLKARRLVRADFIDGLLGHRLAQHPAYHGTMVWVLVMLEQWFAQRKLDWAVPTTTSRVDHEAAIRQA